MCDYGNCAERTEAENDGLESAGAPTNGFLMSLSSFPIGLRVIFSIYLGHRSSFGVFILIEKKHVQKPDSSIELRKKNEIPSPDKKIKNDLLQN